MKQSAKDAIEALLKECRDIAATAETADRDLTGEERAAVTEKLGKATAIRKRETDAEELSKQLADLTDGIGVVEPQTPQQPAGYAAKGRGALGQAFVDSAEFKALVASAPNGRFGESARVQSQAFGVKDLLTGADHDGSAGSLVQADYRGLLDPFYQRPLTLRQLVAPGKTGSDTVEFVRMLSATNNAAPVAEATSAGAIGSGAPGFEVTEAQAGVKPESAITFEKDSTNVKTIAHWIPATKRALSDPAQIRTLIDSFLRTGLEEVLEDQIIGGNGVGENFLGLAATSGIQTQTAPGVGEDVFTITRRARRKVRIGGRTVPTAYAMNPIDWENVELMRDGNERFFGAGPFAMSPNTLWGLPVIESEAVTAGVAWCANWKMAVLYDREQASIQVTDSHADFFIRNLVAILAELRAAFAVLRPQAFVKITL